MNLRIGLLSALLLTSTACGPKDDGETAGETEPTSASTDPGDTTDPTEPTPTSTGPTTGADVCEPFLDQPVTGPEVLLKIENRRETPVFVRPRDCTEQPPLQLFGPGDEELLNGSLCELTCADYFAGTCTYENGYLVNLIRIQPGGIFTFTWSGAVLDIVDPPTECIPLAECQTGCAQRRQADPGEYTLRVEIAAGLPPNCEDLAACDCFGELHPDGWCQIGPNLGAIGEVVAVDAAFTYPDDGAVAVIVD